jgi:hypothetical protein
MSKSIQPLVKVFVKSSGLYSSVNIVRNILNLDQPTKSDEPRSFIFDQPIFISKKLISGRIGPAA